MKKFIFKSIFALLVTLGLISLLLIFSGGYVDYFYEKFTSPKASSLILGDSRSMQGIQPKVINENFEYSDNDFPILNYSFTIAQIAYGPSYLKSIKKKLDTINNANNGLFILTVSPWLLSQRPEDNFAENSFFEDGLPPHNMNYVNINPNFEYFFKNFNYFHFRAVFRRNSKLHKDGWLEEFRTPNDEETISSWKEIQQRMYYNFALRWKSSKYRLLWLENTIKYLKKWGNVFVVRMPIDQEIKTIEDNYWPNFDEDIKEIGRKAQVKYLNFSLMGDSYETFDGNHLNTISGATFTKDLCDSIRLFD